MHLKYFIHNHQYFIYIGSSTLFPARNKRRIGPWLGSFELAGILPVAETAEMKLLSTLEFVILQSFAAVILKAEREISTLKEEQIYQSNWIKM